MTKKQKLELTWIGKETRPKLEPRILLEDRTKSYHAKFRNSLRPLGEGLGVREDLFDNRLIFGDNLLALKALKALEAQRNQKRRTLFDAQDRVDAQRDALIAQIEGKLQQSEHSERLFIARWRIE